MPMVFDVYAAAAPNGSLLGTLTDAFAKSYTAERNGGGAGLFSIKRSSSQATAAIIAQGNLVKVRLTELGATPVGAFWMETGRFDLISSDETGGEVLTFGGKQAFAYLNRAILWSAAYVVGQPQPVDGAWLLSTGTGGNKAGNILKWIVDEILHGARPQHPVPSLTFDFTATLDSAGAAWAATPGTVGLKAQVGEHIDDVISKVAAAGSMAVEMSPSLVLSAWNSRGTNRTSATFASTKVRLQKGANIATSLSREIAAGRIPSHALVSGTAGAYGTASNAVTPVREEFATGEGDATALAALASAFLSSKGINADAIRLGVPYGNVPLSGIYLPGPPAVGGHFWIDDTVTLHTGTAAFDYNESAQKVAAITYGENEGGDVIVEVALGSNYSASEFGSVATALGDLETYLRSLTSVVVSRVDVLAATTADVLAPNTPTGLALSTSLENAPDGTIVPTITASWTANGEPDLDAYEGQVAEALQGEAAFSVSASGTGGSLAAGSYNVAVTGVGTDGGETKATSDKSITITAGQRLFVNITALTGMASYRIYASRSGTGPPRFAQTAVTTGSNVEVTVEGAGGFPPLASTALAFTNPVAFRTSALAISIFPVKGGRYYGVRIRAQDRAGNRSAFTSIVGITAARDATAPAIPTGLVAIAGFRLAGVRWADNIEPDLGGYELRWTPQVGGVPDTTAWTNVTVRGTSSIITDLVPGTVYYFQVRALDTSGNVATSAADPTAVDAQAFPEAGWSNVSPDYVTVIPVAVGAADFAANSIIANILAAGSIDAGTIKTGTLSIGGNSGTPDYLLIYNNSGIEIGRWDANGLLIKDPANTSRQMRLRDGVLAFSSDNGVTWTTAINADGIDAGRITFGSAGGGHNTVPNSSLEMSAFGAVFTKIWTLTGDWATTIGTNVNLATGTGDLGLTTFSY